MIDLILLILFIYYLIIIYYKFIRFSRKNIINKIVKNHITKIKSYFNDSNLKYIDYVLDLGQTVLIDSEVVRKLEKFIVNRGFKAKCIESRDGHTIIEIE